MSQDERRRDLAEDWSIVDHDDLVERVAEVIGDVGDTYPRRRDDAPSVEVADAIVTKIIGPMIMELQGHEAQQTAAQTTAVPRRDDHE